MISRSGLALGADPVKKPRELSGDELYGATSMDEFKELARARCGAPIAKNGL